MKYLITLLFSFCFYVSFAQEPAYTPMRLNYQFRGIKVDSLFLVPSFTDTTAANNSTMKNVAGALIRTGNGFWMRNTTTNAWLQTVNTGPGSTFDLDLQEITDNGDSTTNLIYFYDDGVLSGHNSTVKIGTGIIDGSNYGSIVGIYGDVIDANPHKIELFTTKGDGYNYFTMHSGVEQFNISNAPGATNISSLNQLNINSEIMNLQVDSLVRTFTDRIQQTISDSLFKVQTYPVGNDLLKIDTLGNFQIGDASATNINATDDLTLNATDDITIDAADIMTIESGELRIIVGSTFDIDKINSTPTIIGPSSTPSELGYILQNRSDSVDLDASTFNATVPGVYRVWNGNAYDFVFPDATTWIGQMVVIINRSGLTIDLSGSQNIYDRGTGNLMTTLDATRMGTFFSDGYNWYGFFN